jgi:chromosome segregation ATPase
MTDELDALEKRLRDIGKYMLSFTADEAADAIASLRRQLAEKEDETKALHDAVRRERWRAEAAESNLASLQSQLTAERERAEKAEEWATECACNAEINRLRVETLERGDDVFKFRAAAQEAINEANCRADAAQAEARELREWADAMNTALDAFWNDPERPSLHRMRSETTSKICVLQEKHRTRIDAKLTEGA